MKNRLVKVVVQYIGPMAKDNKEKADLFAGYLETANNDMPDIDIIDLLNGNASNAQEVSIKHSSPK